jgi:VIT1/CCC1 family predicted Fe2+/Mn2+ transporter
MKKSIVQDKDFHHSHDPESIRQRLEHKSSHNYLKEWVYGGVDGTVTTFAIISGVIGASLSPVIVVILGIANLLGDGFSMAAGAYSASKTDLDNYNRLRSIERDHIKKYPQGEKEEIRQIFSNKGFEGDVLDNIVEKVVSDEELWVDIMMSEEHGVMLSQKRPLISATHTFIAFVICGMFPLLPFIMGVSFSFYYSIGLSIFTFFTIGAFKSYWSPARWWVSGLETTIIGFLAALIAYAMGYYLKNLII